MEKIRFNSFLCFLLSLGIAGAVLTSCLDGAPGAMSGSVSLSLSRTTLSVAATASRYHTFDVTTTPSNLGWTVEVTSGSEWCMARPESGAGEGTVTLDIAATPLSVARSATITVTAIMPDKKAKPVTEQLIVTQAAAYPILTVDKTSIDGAVEANNYPIIVTSNVAWTVVPDAVAPWCSLSSGASGSGNGTFSIILTSNPGEDRKATITVKPVGEPSLPDCFIFVVQRSLSPILALDRYSISASIRERLYPVAVKANGPWEVSMNPEAASWCSIQNPPGGNGDGTFSVNVQANPTQSGRVAYITVSSRGLTRTLTVSQVYEFTETGGGSDFDMIGVAAGTFIMGGTIDSDERPPHRVTLTKNYALGKFEVTQKLWLDLMGDWPNTNPNDVPHPPLGSLHAEITNMVGDDYPMYYVSEADIQRFLTELNARTGKKYRLPTEAEWEYAARGSGAGHGYAFSGSDNPDLVAWYIDNSRRKTHPVGTLASNELGFYDMSGNVWELCSDWFDNYSSSEQIDPKGPAQPNPRAMYYVARGGALDYGETSCRVSYRMRCPPGVNDYHLGFRLALTLP